MNMIIRDLKKEDYDLDKVFRVEKWVFTPGAMQRGNVGKARAFLENKG